ncbi:MAG: acyl carrier protein [Planctomycetes bacterium]|nr:acyl carrier protein [Planctomycetota bacterium]
MIGRNRIAPTFLWMRDPFSMMPDVPLDHRCADTRFLPSLAQNMDDDMEDTRRTILGILERKTGKPVRPEDTFATLQIDSLLMAELAYEIEQAYGIHTGEGMLDCETVEDLARYIGHVRQSSAEARGTR